MIISITGLFSSLVIILIILIHQPCRTASNLLLINTCVAVSAGYINTFIESIYGFHEDWARNQPLCVFRAYCFMASGIAICYSYLAQAISRLFFVVFFRHQRLLTFRVHWYIVTLNWIISFLGSVVPLLVKDGYQFNDLDRLCLPSDNHAPTTIIVLILGLATPLNLSIVVYYKIWRRAVQSSRRILPTGSEVTTKNTPNMRREMKIARNMTILLSLYGLGGMPISIVVFWRMINPNDPPPEPLYLLASNAISLFVALINIALFMMNRQLKDIGVLYIRRLCRRPNK